MSARVCHLSRVVKYTAAGVGRDSWAVAVAVVYVHELVKACGEIIRYSCHHSFSCYHLSTYIFVDLCSCLIEYLWSMWRENGPVGKWLVILVDVYVFQT
jgi:hypothetical protein